MPKPPPSPDPRDELLDLAKRIITTIEWAGPEGRCPFCHRQPVVGHTYDCPVGRVLAEIPLDHVHVSCTLPLMNAAGWPAARGDGDLR